MYPCRSTRTGGSRRSPSRPPIRRWAIRPSAAAGFTDGTSDVLYTFYLATDSTLVDRPFALAPASFFTIGADRSPLAGTRQNPRLVPATFIRESFASDFPSAAADSINGMISLDGTTDNTVYYVYILADPAPNRFPSLRLTGGSAKKDYDPTALGAFTGGVYLGRSGPILVTHPPEFVVVGWDYDTDNGDDFDNTGVIQMPSDIVGMAAVDVNRKDNRNITIDSGSFFSKGLACNSVNNGSPPDPLSSVDLLFLAPDAFIQPYRERSFDQPGRCLRAGRAVLPLLRRHRR